MISPEDDTSDLLSRGRLPLFAGSQSKLVVQVASGTHQGKMRTRNEDHHAVIRRTRCAEMLSTNLPSDSWSFAKDEAYVLIVADGVGGAVSGDQASRLAVQTVLGVAENATSWMMKYHELEFDAFRARVEAYLEAIQKQFFDYAQRDPASSSMGTTLTAAVVLPPHALIVQIGDSRAYCLRDNQLQQLTRDQTLAQDLLDEGVAPEEARRYSNVLTNSLGGGANQVQAEIVHLELQANDRLMLCSDGLTDMVDDETIAQILADSEPQPACEQLIDRALDAGGKDNITVIVSAFAASGVAEH